MSSNMHRAHLPGNGATRRYPVAASPGVAKGQEEPPLPVTTSAWPTCGDLGAVVL